MARYIAARIDWTAEQLASASLEYIWRDRDLSNSIVSDIGFLFTLKFRSALCFHLRIKQRFNIAFHPRTDRQTKRQKQTLEQCLQGYGNYQQDDLVEWLGIE